MLRFYYILNKRRCSLHVATTTEDRAKQIAIECNHVKAIKNAKINDVTDECLFGNDYSHATRSSLQEILNGESEGLVGLEIPAESWNDILDILDGKLKEKRYSKWVLYRVFGKVVKENDNG